MSKRVLQSLFYFLGMLIFGYLIYRLGWQNLWDSILQTGWWWIPVFALALIWQMCHTRSWYDVLYFFEQPVGFGKLFKLKLIADAVNMILPTANLGGDTLRAHLIRKEVPSATGISSVVIDKTLDYISKMVFNIIGFGTAVFFIEIPPVWFWGCVIYLIVNFIFYILLIGMQVKGLSGWMLRLTKLIPPLYRALEKRKAQLQLLDENLNSAYTTGKSTLILAGGWQVLGRLLGMAEIWLLLWVLGAPTSFVEVFFISAVVNVVNGAFSIVPGQWGVSEGAQLMMVQLLGFSAGIGLSLGVIRRIRRLVLAGVGMVIYYFEDNG